MRSKIDSKTKPLFERTKTSKKANPEIIVIGILDEFLFKFKLNFFIKERLKLVNHLINYSLKISPKSFKSIHLFPV